MKLEIYNESEPKQDEPVRLQLKHRGNKIAVIAVDAEGQDVSQGWLLSFTNDGSITRPICVSKKLGFNLTRNGRISLVDE